MENLTNFAFIPTFVRRIISCALVFVCCGLIAGIVAMIVLKQTTYLGTVADLAKIAFSGLGVWVFLIFNSRSVSTKQLLARSDAFLTKEMTRALALIGRPAAQFGNGMVATSRPVEVTLLPSDTQIQCYYEIKSPELGTLRMHIQCNVSRMLVVYFLSPEFADQHATIQKNTIVGAESAGWKSHVYGVKKADFLADAPDYFELMFERTLRRDFLFSSSEQLFIANDVAMMTRSVMLEHARRADNERTLQLVPSVDEASLLQG